ncbi:hypothetical protein Afil01_61980 [Actinorhabdospora filicis]|uniref:Uncharacterized protein n=1 Tax=Actinorhabdospora filicis TaxID=1785913 RepID=A0A9W6SS35_9ACTN|nr:hypothetical protein Afil01_61980 [Actinorhabdospora filicis]
MDENWNPFHAVLDTIAKYDPEGGETEPTESDRDAHEAWARERYGDETWEAYRRGGWHDPYAF